MVNPIYLHRIVGGERAYDDCVMPEACECRRRGFPRDGVTICLIPDVNAVAIELGWKPPYPDQPLNGRRRGA